MGDREKNMTMAKLAEQTERYPDMVCFMKLIAEEGKGLNQEERNLFSVAYKNVVGAKRSSWRILSSLKPSDMDATVLQDYIGKVEKELRAVCDDVLDVIKSYLVPNANDEETKVFLHKMKGDYHRYVAEILSGSDKKDESEKAKSAYKTASDSALNLPATHPIRLGLALNFSVFYYEIVDSKDKACELAKKAFDDAITELDSLSEDSYKDSTLIMQLLRDNLTLWTSDVTDTTAEGEVVQDIEDK